MSEQIRLFEPDLSSWVEAVWKQAGPEPRREIIAILAEIGRCALEEQHELLRDEDRGVLIDFWSPWCAPLSSSASPLEQDGSRVRPSMAFCCHKRRPTSFGRPGVSGVGTSNLVWFRNGHELGRLSGGVTLSSVVAKLDELTRELVDP
jgi:hypothetical protein